ncbi:hypothetical protein DOY81_010801 [Sarcophaga bullata]|nr:hypothetical protein DOY81_010801 [Sarcophaga bullata]
MLNIQSSTLLPTACADLASANLNPGVEAIRKLAQVQLLPIKTEKLQLSLPVKIYNLNNYLKSGTDNKQIEQLDWIFFMVGCLNAAFIF